MGNAPFLAMTASEIRANPEISAPIGWMACHFSPCGTGLSNLPVELPEGSLLILNDQLPWAGHDPSLIADQLEERLTAFSCYGLLMDFQRPGVPEVADLAKLLTERLTCPVGVSEGYAESLSCPVFLPPVPLQQTVEEYLHPWQGREIWLELALDSEEILLTPQGCSTTPLPSSVPSGEAHKEETLHCHYTVELQEESARFTLKRTREDLDTLLTEAKQFGATSAVGLWQELGAYVPCRGGS